MTTQTLNSIGHVCQILQRLHGPILKAAKALGVEPAARINGVAHFTDQQVEAIAEHLRGGTRK